jgi:hypothetical protein
MLSRLRENPSSKIAELKIDDTQQKDKIKFVIALLVLGISVHSQWAIGGCAVGVDYPTGRVSYYRSSTRKGLWDYKSAADACAYVLLKMKGLGAKDPQIIYSSDLTGYFTVAEAANESGVGHVSIGYGPAQVAADANAYELLNTGGYTAKQRIIYRFFSNGSQSEEGGIKK